MFNIGGSEMVFLAILALLVFGPQGLPDVAKTVARTIKAFRAAANDLQSEVKTALDLENTGVQKKDDRGHRARQRALPPSPSVGADSEAVSNEEESPKVLGPIAAEPATTDLVPAVSSEVTSAPSTDLLASEDLSLESPVAEISEDIAGLEIDDDGPQIPMVKRTRVSTPAAAEVEPSS